MTDESTPCEPWIGTANGRGPNGLFASGNKLGTGNPIARLHYENRKRFLDAVTPDELDKARAQLVADMLDPSARVRATARGQYYEWVHGKRAQPITLDRGNDGSSQSAADDALNRILAWLEARHPELKSEAADVLLSGVQAIEIDPTVVTTGEANNVGD